MPDSDNEKDDRALLVTDEDAVPLGWVPNPLLELVHEITDPVVTVLRANGPEVGFHLRLLVGLTGRLPVGYQPFSGSRWETVD